jgi:hypothetical protein
MSQYGANYGLYMHMAKDPKELVIVTRHEVAVQSVFTFRVKLYEEFFRIFKFNYLGCALEFEYIEDVTKPKYIYIL